MRKQRGQSDQARPRPPATLDGVLRGRLWQIGLPLGLSLLIHVGGLGFLAFKTFDVIARDGHAVTAYEASLTERVDEDTPVLDWTSDGPLDPPLDMPLEPPPTAVAEIDLPPLAAPRFGDPTGTPDGGPGLGDGAGLGLGDGALSVLGTGSGAGRTGAGGLGGGGVGAGATPGQAGIWNLRVRANRIVYVVDFSGSIIVAVDELKRELKRSISRLQSDQDFNVVIFYSTGAGPDEQVRTEAFRPQLEPADEPTRRAFFEWIDRKQPRGATEPLQAMRRALALAPDAVFFFSDGYFEDSLVEALTEANRETRASIHCLVFDELLLQDMSDLPRETEGARRLKRIAEANRGRVQVVTGRDLVR